MRKTKKNKDDVLQLLKESCGKAYPETAPLSLKKENTCEVSIIIPAYNMGNWRGHEVGLFNRCLISVTAALYFSIDFSCEVILIDDGSTDKTVSMMEGFREDPRINKGRGSVKVMIIRQKHLGVAAARNAGLRVAGGKYVFFLDADDEFVPDCYLKTLYDLAELHQADICVGKRLGNFFEPAYPGASKEVTVLTKYEEFRRVSGYVTGKLIRRSLFDGTAFPEGLIYEDTLLPLVLYPRCRKIVCTESALAFYEYTVNRKSGIAYSTNTGDLGADAAMAALECVRSFIRLEKETDGSGENPRVACPGIWWYRTVVNHLGGLLYFRTVHCSQKTMRYAFLLACEVADLAAEEAGVSAFFPVSTMDFILRHHLYRQWIRAGQVFVISDRARNTILEKEHIQKEEKKYRLRKAAEAGRRKTD